MAKVTCNSVKVERKPVAFMHTHLGNIAFPSGHFDSAAVFVYDCERQTIVKSASLWINFQEAEDWVPIYDGDTIKIAFGESNDG